MTTHVITTETAKTTTAPIFFSKAHWQQPFTYELHNSQASKLFQLSTTQKVCAIIFAILSNLLLPVVGSLLTFYIITAACKAHNIRKALKACQPPGIRNLGNSCYMNSAIQLLAYTPPVVDGLREQVTNAAMNPANLQIKEAFLTLQRTITATKKPSSSATAVEAKNFRTALFGAHLPEFPQENISKQQDAASLLGVLLEDFTYNVRVKRTSAAAGAVKKVSTEREGCFFSDTLPPAGETLENMIQSQFSRKTIQADCRFSLEDGGEIAVNEFTQKKQIVAPPPFLLLHIKRFTHSPKGNIWKKNNCPTTFKAVNGMPMKLTDKGGDTIDLSPCRQRAGSDERPPIAYQVTGFIIHHGEEMNSGHYSACIKSAGNWYHCDDKKVSSLTPKALEALQKQTYLLMLTKIGLQEVT